MAPRALRLATAAAVVAVLLGGVFLVAALAVEVSAAPAPAGHHDFLAFHAAAQLILHGGAGRLYDPAAISSIERTVLATPVGAAGYMPYLTPPFGAVVQAPLGLLDEPAARLVWLGLSLPLGLLCGWLATVGMERPGRLVAVVCLASTFPFFQAFVEGQWSFVMLLGCQLALLAARRGHPGWAGAGLAVLALKPPLLVPVLIVLLLRRAWPTVAALVAALVAVLAVTLPFTGITADLDYARFLVGVVGSHLDGAGAAGASVWQGAVALTEGVNGLVAGYVGQQRVAVVDAVTLVLVLAVAGWWVRTALRSGLGLGESAARWALVAAVAAALLTDLHLYPQDCILVLVVLPVVIGLVPRGHGVAVALAVAALLDSAWLDQLRVTPHLFTWLLGAGFLLACRQAARRFPVAPDVKVQGLHARRLVTGRSGWTSLDEGGRSASS